MKQIPFILALLLLTYSDKGYSMIHPSDTIPIRNYSENGGEEGEDPNSIGTSFALSGSPAFFRKNLFSSLGINCTLIDTFNDYITRNSIRDEMPVLVSGYDSNITRSNDGEGGRLIDGLQSTRYTEDYQQYLRIIPTDSLSFYPDLNYDMILTDSQKQFLYPDIEEYETIHEYNYYYSYLYSMNWGWNGSYNGYYSSAPLEWNPDNSVYNDRLKMIYGFSVDE